MSCITFIELTCATCSTPTRPALLPRPLPAALGPFRATLLFLLLRLLEHGKIAFHALAFFGTPLKRTNPFVRICSF
jgi:hypothetical protein